MQDRNEPRKLYFNNPFTDTRVEGLMISLSMRLYGTTYLKEATHGEFRKYCDIFSNLHLEELSWMRFCDIVDETKKYRWSLFLLDFVLDMDDWHDPYKGYLKDIQPTLKKAIQYHEDKRSTGEHSAIAIFQRRIFCRDDIRRLIYIPNNVSGESVFSAFLVRTDNQHLRHEIQGFFEHKSRGGLNQMKALENNRGFIATIFEKTVPEFSEKTHITDSVFWKQVEMVKEMCGTGHALPFDYLIEFYRFLINSDMPDLLSGNPMVTPGFLSMPSLVRSITQGYVFAELKPGSNTAIEDKDKVVLVLQGYDRMLATMGSIKFMRFDMSELIEKRYLPILWRYLIDTIPIRPTTHQACALAFTRCLNFITRLKEADGHPNPDPFNITRAECLALQKFIESTWPNGRNSSNRAHFLMKSFFRFAESQELITVQELALDTFRQLQDKDVVPINTTIPPEEIRTILDALEEDSKTDYIALLLYGLCLLLIDTEFRIGNLCALRRDSLKQGSKSGEWYIEALVKTSRGQWLTHVITGKTAAILLKCKEATEGVLEVSTNPNIAPYMFIYYSQRQNQYRRINSSSFLEILNRYLRRHGIEKRYNASAFRNTHMTKAIQYSREKGKTKLEASMLTKHKSLATTLTNYYGSEESFIEQMEDTYNIEISADLSVPGTVVKINEPVKEAEVEHGCGSCSEKHCILKTNLPCLLCPSFVTTPDHEPFFEQAIGMLSSRLMVTEDEHEIEDLKTKKAILVLYLKKIHDFRRNMQND